MTPFLAGAIAEMLPDADPEHGCRKCGFAWSVGADETLAHLRGGAARFADLLAGRDASRKLREDVWSPSAYVWHVGDVTRAWSERLHALGADPHASWAGFDPDELGRARRYEELPPVTGPWALERATDALEQALAPLDIEVGFTHPEWGRGTVTDALRWVGHEVVHHDLDVRRGLGLT
jgi:hypothetical protein